MVSKASYDGPVSIWCKGMFLDLAYFRNLLIGGLSEEVMNEALLAIRFSRFYPKSAGNEANYETFCENLEALAPEFPRLELVAREARALLSLRHVQNASAETLVDFCLTELEKEDLPQRAGYERVIFQLSRQDALSPESELRIHRRVLSAEAGWNQYLQEEKLSQLLSPREILAALDVVPYVETRKSLLRCLISKGLVREVLAIAKQAGSEERGTIFYNLANEKALVGEEISEDESRFWLEVLADEPQLFFRRTWSRIVEEPESFAFLLSPLKKYFFANLGDQTDDFLWSEEDGLPTQLLTMLLILDPVFDEKVWTAAARYRGYRIVEIDCRNGFKFGERTAKNFPISEIGVSRLIQAGVALPADVPDSVPEPYRDPRDR